LIEEVATCVEAKVVKVESSNLLFDFKGESLPPQELSKEVISAKSSQDAKQIFHHARLQL